MRKLLTFLIALAAISPAYADTVKSTFDFGPASPERQACVMFTCRACYGAQSISINGVELTRDVTSGGEDVAEIWSALLPEGSGEQLVLITSERSLAGADVALGAMNAEIAGKFVKRTASGLSAYSLDTVDGDVVVAVSRGGSSYEGSTEAPWKLQVGHSRIAIWNIERALPAFTVSGPSAVSVVAVYR